MCRPSAVRFLTRCSGTVFLAGALSANLCANAISTGPADARILDAEKKLHANPESFQAYNDLAFALCRKARDTGEQSLYDRADAAIARSRRLSPGNYEAKKLEIGVLLGRQDYLRALPLAKALNASVPDDIAGWGLLVDSNVAVGNYPEAERDAQWILDLRQGSALGFEKAALLRELFGDSQGAVEFFDEALRRTSANDADGRAWFLLQKARLQFAAGFQGEAQKTLAQARQLDPESVLALKLEAAFLEGTGKAGDAVPLLQRCYDRVPTTRNLYALAEALERSGRSTDADVAFRRFAQQAQSGVGTPGNPTVQLVLYKLQRENDTVGALALVSRLAQDYHDHATLDALAWALYCNGKYQDAKIQLDRSLTVGIRNPLYFCHGLQISNKLGDRTAADQYKRDLGGFDGYSCPADLSTRAGRS